MGLIHIMLLLAGVYAVIGIVFAMVFVTVGVPRVDHVAKGAPIGFRLLIFPGSAALWPVMLAKWVRAKQGGEA